MSNLILKYNISEKDLYALGLIETKKKSVGYLEKEKLKAASLKILKPYNVKFMDIGGISGEIKQGGFDNKYSDSISQEEKLAIEKMIQENSNVSKFFKEWWSGKSKKQKWIIVIAVLFVFGFIGSVTGPTECECNKELNRLLQESAFTGNTDGSALSRQCDRLYPNVSYIHAECD
jgi:hypothetical protein